MDIHALDPYESWQWPENAGDAIRLTLSDRDVPSEDRVLAAQLAGDTVVLNDETAELLLSVVGDPAEPADLRSAAAISLGPALELCEMEGFEGEPFADPPVSQPVFERMQETLRATYDDESAPKDVRRRALEASVRASQDWHTDAIRAAAAQDDPEWQMTAIFSMQYVPGFEDEIVKYLESDSPELRYEAVRAAGARGLDAAWPYIESIVNDPSADKELLLSAIAAAPNIRPEEAGDLVLDLVDSDDEEISEAATAAMMEARTRLDAEEGEYDEDEEQFELEDEEKAGEEPQR